MSVAFIVLILSQAIPPPGGTLLVTLMLGTQMASAPAQTCCGVPSSPRGPR